MNVRELHHRGCSVREIARKTGLSRGAVRRMLCASQVLSIVPPATGERGFGRTFRQTTTGGSLRRVWRSWGIRDLLASIRRALHAMRREPQLARMRVVRNGGARP